MNYPLSLTKVAYLTKQAIDEGFRIVANQGGTGSAKTCSLVDLLICEGLTTKTSISITSLSLPHLKKGAMRDWQMLMDKNGIYSESKHNKTDHTYVYPSGGYIEFFSLDQARKVRGPRRDVLFINEANLIDYETWKQLLWRTNKTIVIDYNPADEFHWIYDEVLTRTDCKFIQSTYLDNPFLLKEIVNEIERDRNGDQNLWKVYGLGERGTSEASVYTHWDTYEEVSGGDEYFGLDFGYNNPAALIKETMKDDERYWQELVYENHLTTSDLVAAIKPIVGHKPVYCDSDEQMQIAELCACGINAYKAIKDVRMGIDEVKRKPLHIHKYSPNLLKEIKSYKWLQNKDGKILKEEVVKRNDHLMDAGRYAAFTHKGMHVSHQFTAHR